MESIFAGLSFFGTPGGSTVLGTLTALMIILWDWRFALVTLFCVQVGVASAAVTLGDLPAEWATVMVIITGLACLILTISAQQMTRTTTLYQSGTWQLRALLVALVYVGWELAEVNLPLPKVNPQLADLFVWLALCMLVMLGLSQNPLFAVVAFLMWLIPVQVLAAAIVNSPALVALIGMLSLLLALAGSYLILVEQVTVDESAPVVTDIAFPSDLGIPAATNFVADEEYGWLEWLLRQQWAAPLVDRTRRLLARRRP